MLPNDIYGACVFDLSTVQCHITPLYVWELAIHQHWHLVQACIACIHHHQYQNHQTTPQSNLSAKSNLGSRNELLLRGFYCSTVVFWKETFLSMWMLRFISDKLDLLPELDLGLSGNKQRSNWNHVGNVSPLQGRCRDPIYICRVQDIKSMTWNLYNVSNILCC